ncbi:MAG: Na+/H+ antiporter NhaA [Phycisphaerae bacterium]
MSHGGIPSRLEGRSTVRIERMRGLPLGRVTQPVLGYIYAEQAAGIMLIFGAIGGIVWANAGGAGRESYDHFWHTKVTVAFVSMTLHHWVNDALMTLFFLLVGLEIKRELVVGNLSSVRKAGLPVIAALGGMVVPAGMFLAFAAADHRPGAGRGWGVPVATDIAFAMGVLALLGDRAPRKLKIFLLAFATADDVGGVLIIAVAYTEHLSTAWLTAAGALAATIYCLRAARVSTTPVFALLGVALWYCTYRSGVHATISGVVLGLLAPVRPYIDADAYLARATDLLAKVRQAHDRGEHDRAETMLGALEELTRGTERPGERFERLLRPWVSFIVLPVFALANTGVPLTGEALAAVTSSPAAWGIVVALTLGKLVGVFGATWLAVKMRISDRPEGVTWQHIAGASILAGIGFTVSIFIAELAFKEGRMLDGAKLAVLAASVIAAIAGAGYLIVTGRRKTDVMSAPV